jgi:hypothetical protein
MIYLLSFCDIEKLEFSTSSIKCEKCLNITNYQIVFLPYKNEFILIENSLCNESNNNIYKNIYLYTPNYKPPSNNPDSEFLNKSTSPFIPISIKNSEVLKTNLDAYSTVQSFISTKIESIFPTTSFQKISLVLLHFQLILRLTLLLL